MVIISDVEEESDAILSVMSCICKAALSHSYSKRDMHIRNVEFVNARTKLAHCMINNMNVDITINQSGAVATSIFFEEADRIIGNDHLFKKSVMLLKVPFLFNKYFTSFDYHILYFFPSQAWCLHDSPRYNYGVPISGAKSGMLSSYALSVLVLYLFNIYTWNKLDHPLAVLRAFLRTYYTFPWER